MSQFDGVTKAVLAYLALKRRADANAYERGIIEDLEHWTRESPQDLYVELATGFLLALGEKLERIHRNETNIINSSLNDDLVRYRAWSDEHKSEFDPWLYFLRGLSTWKEDKKQAAVSAGFPETVASFGIDLEDVREGLDGGAAHIQVFARPRIFGGKSPPGMNVVRYVKLSSAKAPRKLTLFDEAIHSLVPSITGLSIAIDQFTKGDPEAFARITSFAEAFSTRYSELVELFNKAAA